MTGQGVLMHARGDLMWVEGLDRPADEYERERYEEEDEPRAVDAHAFAASYVAMARRASSRAA